jgi:hypothetical protein
MPFAQARKVQCAITGFIVKEIVKKWFVENVERESYVEEEEEKGSDETKPDEITCGIWSMETFR